LPDASWNNNLSALAETIRLSYGAGIVLRLGGIARLELNYCVPVRTQKGDRQGISARNNPLQLGSKTKNRFHFFGNRFSNLFIFCLGNYIKITNCQIKLIKFENTQHLMLSVYKLSSNGQKES